jgi:hypothetical protein
MTLSPTLSRILNLTRLPHAALAAAMAMLAAAPGLGHADPHTTIAGHGAGGQYIGSEGSYASPVAQSFDFSGSQDHFIGSADYGRVGFSYAVSGFSTPFINYTIGASYLGGFTDTFSVASSGLPYGADVLVHVHVTLKSSVVLSNDFGGQIQFRQSTYTAEADGRPLMVSQSNPTAQLDYDLHAWVGYSGWQISAGLPNLLADVYVNSGVQDRLRFSATWDLLPAHGYGLSYTISTDPGVSLTFDSHHNYAAPVPEPATVLLWLAGLGAVPVAARRSGRANGPWTFK